MEPPRLTPAPPATTEADQVDLSNVEDGLFGNFDITLSIGESTSPAATDDAPVDPKAARLEAAFQRARRDYTVKIEDEAWYLPSSSSLRDANGKVDVARFRVPSPTELRRARIENKRQSLDQEWTIDYLYSTGRFDLALAYATSFLYSMDLPLRLDIETANPLDPFPRPPRSSELTDPAKPATKTKATKRATGDVKGPTKELLDAGLRSVLSLAKLQSQPTSAAWDPASFGADISVETWTARLERPPDSGPSHDSLYHLSNHPVRSIALGLLNVAYTEVRRGAGDLDRGFRNLVVRDPANDLLVVNNDRLKLQNWTICPGTALSMGQLSVEMGQWRLAVESLAMFLANRGPHWRGLLPCAFALTKMAATVDGDEELKLALDQLIKALAVLALQSAPRRRRNELARLVLNGGVIDARLVDATLSGEACGTAPDSAESQRRDARHLDTLLRRAKDTLLAEEIIVALCSVVCHKKGGVSSLAFKLRAYLDNCLRNEANDEAEADDDVEDAATQMRSVRTL
ncbi:uncharacterized protein PFL1_03568 [Pseudozyma flocculosa PF-1]|uniref:Uncharacterized protein n=2 Tax=Pseudozyma flocculosa TaxID=84751 RepID=A0A5C3F6X0_9BASI|nr:uncharacterized protein PFL1_03568 [Pseudozyma flocculosa PF-1]EPQ28765.1 hypothetical protein PFL1_03568 [Pseudozyma flocculosa PF-1]SPO39457.1 uncharacterized protein PSFLO_04938 [Pseudozyma flocculosa]